LLTEASVNEGYSEDASWAGEVGQPGRDLQGSGGSFDRTQPPKGCSIFVIHKGPNLGGVISTFIFFSTIVSSVCLGIFAAYASVVGILRALAPRTPNTPKPQPVLVQTQAHAAAASGD
jgi:hypothetical protein